MLKQVQNDADTVRNLTHFLKYARMYFFALFKGTILLKIVKLVLNSFQYGKNFFFPYIKNNAIIFFIRVLANRVEIL